MIADKVVLKEFVHSLGFELAGFTKAKTLDDDARKLESWLNHNHQGEMTYLERYFDFRIDPGRLMPGTKTIIVLGLNYYQRAKRFPEGHPKISNYAYGKDYHKVVRKKIKEIIRWMKQEYGNIQARGFVDSGPVLERAWAREAGVGWIGKNTLAIHPGKGSYFFLCCILTDVQFDYDLPIKDYCGTCRKCIDACPTNAFHPEGYLLDASKCISYLTIELKNQIPEVFRDNMQDWIFGCDVCQEVCPWNRFSKETGEAEFTELPGLTQRNYEEWLQLNEEEFERLYRHSPLQRPGLDGIKRNVMFSGKFQKQ